MKFDAIPPELLAMSGLTSLRLNGCFVTTATLPPLATLRSLQRLTMEVGDA